MSSSGSSTSINNLFYGGTSGIDTDTYTVSTFGGVTSTLTIGNVTPPTTLSDTDNTLVWFPHYMESTWLPYQYVEYEPIWHKKYARYKIQISKMWI